MAPIKPHWHQPSHGDIQEVIVSAASAASGDEYSTRSVSCVALPPFALFARMATPPCTPVAEPTYATVQVGRDRHIDLNSDLLYINHSCEPSLLFDTSSRAIWVGPRGLQPGDELSFFYPSTEWAMAQPFDCLCGTATCCGRISGASTMAPSQLAGRWLNVHIWDLLEEQEQKQKQKPAVAATNGAAAAADSTEKALNGLLASAEATLVQADKAVEAARHALIAYRSSGSITAASLFGSKANGSNGSNGSNGTNGTTKNFARAKDTSVSADVSVASGQTRRGPTSRELSGEMGGDTMPA